MSPARFLPWASHYTCHLDQSKVPLASPVTKHTEDVVLLITLQYSRTKGWAALLGLAMEQSCLPWWCPWATIRALQNSWHCWREAYRQSSHPSIHPSIQHVSIGKGSQRELPSAPLTPVHGGFLHGPCILISSRQNMAFWKETGSNLEICSKVAILWTSSFIFGGQKNVFIYRY